MTSLKGRKGISTKRRHCRNGRNVRQCQFAIFQPSGIEIPSEMVRSFQFNPIYIKENSMVTNFLTVDSSRYEMMEGCCIPIGNRMHRKQHSPSSGWMQTFLFAGNLEDFGGKTSSICGLSKACFNDSAKPQSLKLKQPWRRKTTWNNNHNSNSSNNKNKKKRKFDVRMLYSNKPQLELALDKNMNKKHTNKKKARTVATRE